MTDAEFEARAQEVIAMKKEDSFMVERILNIATGLTEEKYTMITIVLNTERHEVLHLGFTPNQVKQMAYDLTGGGE